MNKCEYCKMGENPLVGSNCGEIMIRGINLLIRCWGGKYWLSDNSCDEFEILYCPRCGKKLEVNK